jgi:anti-sigma B factor antagonist
VGNTLAAVDELQVTIVEEPEGARIETRGDLDLGGADALNAALAEVEERGLRRVTLDVSRLDFMDSTGLQVILDADLRAAGAGHELVVIVGDGAARRVLELADALPRLKVATADER